MPIQNDAGETVIASTPVIISASRSTDIPAFYGDWFINRLQRGYCTWVNPFNRLKSYISFKRCKVIVFWTKNPAPILPHLPILDAMGIHYYFQFTVNDYEKEGLEPNVPPIEQRIETFKALSQRIGSDRVIWRFDPIVMMPGNKPEEMVQKIQGVGERLKGLSKKLVFSFVDVEGYQKVQRNMVAELHAFEKATIFQAEPTDAQKIAIAKGLAQCRDTWKQEGWNLTLATCAEGIDLQQFGIEHNRCIDGNLMQKVFSDDKELQYYLQTGSLPEKNHPIDLPLLANLAIKKDKGQRKACGCIESKDIGSYNTCRHFCIYCYANTSRKTVTNTVFYFDPTKESIANNF